MKTTILKQAVAATILAMATSAAHAATATFNFDYLANNGKATNIAGTSPKGDFSIASGGTATPVGSITFTDLGDLHLGDGKSGVRVSLTLDNLAQFGVGGSGTGSIFVASFETNFAGTSALTETVGTSWRQVAGGVQVQSIEFTENGTVSSSGLGNNWGNNPSSDPAFEQEINFAAGSFTQGKTASIDFLNGEFGYNGFSVAQLLANPVDSQNASLPNAFGWIKVRSTSGAITTANNGLWWQPATSNANGGRLDILAINAVAAVPEPESYAMMLAGLGLMGFVARRRSKYSA